MSTKRHGHRGKTRPFMPRKNTRLRHNDKVMRVGADAMIEDTPKPDENAGVENNHENQQGEGGEAQHDSTREHADHETPESVCATAAGDQPVPEPAPTEPEAEKMPEPASRKELEDLRAERDSYLELARRERADFDNYRKRVEREMRQIKKDSLAGFLKEFFAPLDDMDRVLAESQKNQSFEGLVTGVRIMEENFWRVFAKIGVRRIDAKGKPFDPNLHEAMAAVPSADVPPNTVLEVYENGYKIDDHVLRPARVVVSRAADE